MKTVAVGEIAEQVTGVTYKKADASDEPATGRVGVLRAGNIGASGQLDYEDLVYDPDSCVKQKQRLRKNDVLIATSSGSLQVVGKAGVAMADRAEAFGAFCKVLRPNSNVDAQYFAQCFRRPEYRQYVERVAAGININNLKKSHLDEIEVPLPPIEEQRRIAAVLDAADELRTKRRQALAKLDSLTQAIFIDMFGDPVTNPKCHEVGRLTDLGELDRGVSKHRPRNDPALLGGEWPLVQTGDVSNSGGYVDSYSSTYSDLGLQQSRLWPKGTLCITIAANIAKTGILQMDACFPDSVVGFTPRDLADCEFVRAFLNFLQPVLEANAPESAQKNINLKVLRELPVPVPRLVARQEFAHLVRGCNEERRAAMAAHRQLDTLFAALQQRAFAGEL